VGRPLAAEEPKLLTRLISQLRKKGYETNAAEAIAVKSLQRSGNLKPGTRTATARGISRGNMSPGERAIDRASRTSGRNPTAYKYNQKTNTATLKRK
jgi:hypothetical protein